MNRKEIRRYIYDWLCEHLIATDNDEIFTNWDEISEVERTDRMLAINQVLRQLEKLSRGDRL